MKTIDVYFIKKMFQSEEGFSVCAAQPTAEFMHDVKLNNYGNVSISGNFEIEDYEIGGKKFTVTIEEDYTSKYPNSYRMVKIHYDYPSTPREQWYLFQKGGFVPEKTYKNFFNEFSRSKDLILDIIVDDPDLVVKKVKGVGKDRVHAIRNRVMQDKGKAIIHAQFGHVPGIGPSTINKIINYEPDVRKTVDQILADPFYLMKIEGVGFTVADAIRDDLSMPLDSRERCLHGIKYYITDKFQSSGDTYADLNTEVEDLAKKLEVPTLTLVDHVKKEIAMDTEDLSFRLKFFGKYVTTQELFDAEQLVFKATNVLKNSKEFIMESAKWNLELDKIVENEPLALSEEQYDFLRRLNEERLMLLIGPGGAGKSWVTRLAVNMLTSANLSVGLFAPTARAAKVMSGYVGKEAMTIHRGMYQYAMANALAPWDVIILDEASMIDSELMAVVYKVMKPGSRLIVIGDDFQLPSVGPGNILYDFINHLEVPMIKLTKIFRQEKGSGILDYATALREGKFYVDSAKNKVSNKEIQFINIEDSDEIKDYVLKLYRKSYRIHDETDIMMLTPVNQGPSGRRTLNKEIQNIVNKNEKNMLVFGQNLENEEDKTYFKANDYITITKNDYDAKDEFGDTHTLVNGDIGNVVSAKKNSIFVKVNDNTFEYKRDNITSNVEHVWATTIHKAQGGQAKDVVIIIPSNSWGLSANMLYTAITRATERCWVVGNFRTLNRASHNLANFRRKTMLSLQAGGKND